MIPNGSAVANLLSADWYHERWPRIPEDELYGSSVTWHDIQVLMHKRRVPDSALAGDTTIPVCASCRAAYWTHTPKLSKTALTNDLWLGRLPPLLRDTNLGHQLLLALGRVVSTKVYLSSSGVDKSVRETTQAWSRRYLQQGLTGTAVVFDNASSCSIHSRQIRSKPHSKGCLKI